MPSGPSDLAAPPFLDHLASESARFRAVLAEAPTGLRVPTCPDWDADDLLWHLAEVQWFWGEIAVAPTHHDRPRSTTSTERRVERPDRPGRPARPLRPLQRTAARTALATLDPATRAVDVGRRAHGRLHRAAAGPRGADPPPRRRADRRVTHPARLSAGSRRGRRGAAHHARATSPSPASDTRPSHRSVTIATVDAMHAWTVTPVRITGLYKGEEIDVRRFLVADGPDEGSAAEICGSAADLDCWLWNRPPAERDHPRGRPRRPRGRGQGARRVRSTDRGGSRARSAGSAPPGRCGSLTTRSPGLRRWGTAGCTIPARATTTGTKASR